VIHALLVLALIFLVLWFVFQGAGAAINLLWLVIVALVVLWLVGFLRSRRSTS
jgi:hypothetical protein